MFFAVDEKQLLVYRIPRFANMSTNKANIVKRHRDGDNTGGPRLPRPVSECPNYGNVSVQMPNLGDMLKRVRDGDDSVQTALRLPRVVFEKLKNNPWGLGVSTAIRQRLDRTFDEETFDQESRDLADSVLWISDELSRQIGVPWHATRKGRQALAAAIEKLLSEGPVETNAAAEDVFGSDDPPTLGRAIARQFLRLKGTMANNVDGMRRIIWGRGRGV
jgi:hypothetical protein